MSFLLNYTKGGATVAMLSCVLNLKLHSQLVYEYFPTSLFNQPLNHFITS